MQGKCVNKKHWNKQLWNIKIIIYWWCQSKEYNIFFTGLFRKCNLKLAFICLACYRLGHWSIMIKKKSVNGVNLAFFTLSAFILVIILKSVKFNIISNMSSILNLYIVMDFFKHLMFFTYTVRTVSSQFKEIAWNCRLNFVRNY